MASIVLVPGAWLGAWAWEPVTAALRAAGHDVHPVTLTGLAERAGEAGADVDLDTHTGDLVRLVTERDLSGVVLVAHSYGGFPATAAAQQLPDRIERLIYVDSGPAPDGVAQLDMHEPEQQQRLREQVGDGTLLPPPPWDPAQEPLLAGLDQAALALLRERSTPHPFGSWTQPISRTGELPVAAALIACSIPLAHVAEMIAAGVPMFVSLAGAELRELPTGHWPMLSEPARLADLIAGIAAGGR